MTAGLSSWPFVGRDQLVQEIVEYLSSDRSAILVGGPGFGKTALAQRALASLNDDSLTFHIRGSAAVPEVPYGPLTFLLSELDERFLAHPVFVLRGLTEHVTRLAAGRRLVFFVDNVEDLDEQSAMAISHLVTQGTVVLVGACESLPNAPEELVHLWRDGVLNRVDVGPLNLDETTAVLKTALGGPVSRSAVQELWTACEGNPLHLRVLTQEQTATKNLIQRDGVWVVLSAAAANRGRLADVLIAGLNRLSEEHRAIMELVALAGSMPLRLLVKIARPMDVDWLQERGSLEIGSAPERVVRIVSALVAQVVRSSVPPGRKCELRERLVEVTSDLPYPPLDVLTFAIWTLDCGAPLDLSLAVRASRNANNRHDPDTALRIIMSRPDRRTEPVLMIEEAKAMMATGRFEQAQAVLERVPANGPQLPIAVWVEFMVLQTTLDRSDPQLHMLARGGMDLVYSRISSQEQEQGHEQEQGTSFSLLWERAKLAEIELAVYEGRYVEILDSLEPMYVDQSHSQSFRTAMGICLSETWTMLGRQDDGVELAGKLVRRLSVQGDKELVDAAGIRLCHNLFLAGRWKDSLAVLKRRRGRQSSIEVDSAGADELIEGMVTAYCGHADAALERLMPALGQLRVRDVAGHLVPALAITAYAQSLRGDVSSVSRLLAEMDRSAGRLSWSLHRGARFFAAMASAACTSPQQAAARLLRYADEDRDSGATINELFLLSSAVRFGHHESAGRLVATAALAQGSFARLCELYGSGIASSDAQQLLSASRMAQSLGQEQWAREAAKSAVQTAAACEREQMVSALRLVGAGPGALRSPGALRMGADGGNHDPLTSRERDIAQRAAAGATSKSIASDLNVSVRTVEGHLYQIYAKLQVKSRSGLEKILA